MSRGVVSYQNDQGRKPFNIEAGSVDSPVNIFGETEEKGENVLTFVKQHFFKLIIVFAAITAVTMLSSGPPGFLGNGVSTNDISASHNKFKPSKRITGGKVASLSPRLTIQTPGYSTVLPAASWLPWDLIAEPSKDQLISLTVMDENEEALALADNDIGVSWTVDGVTYSGTTATIKIPKVGVYKSAVQLYAKSKSSTKAATILGDTSVTYSYSFTIASKYIRREIRSLSDEDREKVLDAIQILYTTDDVSGKEKYGEKYMSMETFLYFHLKGAGTSDCDHWHDGAGIVTHHAAITLTFEQSLQSIDSSIALPYWEYSYDAMVYDDYRDSPFFYPDWFGTASPENEQHAVMSGRWANISMPDGAAYLDAWSQSESGSMNPFVNPYGYMRTPWNMNESPYFGRNNLTYGRVSFDTMPTCTDMYDCYSSDSLADVSLPFLLLYFLHLLIVVPITDL